MILTESEDRELRELKLKRADKERWFSILEERRLNVLTTKRMNLNWTW